MEQNGTKKTKAIDVACFAIFFCQWSAYSAALRCAVDEADMWVEKKYWIIFVLLIIPWQLISSKYRIGNLSPTYEGWNDAGVRDLSRPRYFPSSTSFVLPSLSVGEVDLTVFCPAWPAACRDLAMGKSSKLSFLCYFRFIPPSLSLGEVWSYCILSCLAGWLPRLDYGQEQEVFFSFFVSVFKKKGKERKGRNNGRKSKLISDAFLFCRLFLFFHLSQRVRRTT